MNDSEANERLKAVVDLAIARGVFGLPYFIVNGEASFWGIDRLSQRQKCSARGGS